MFNVTPHNWYMGSTDAERAITFLPPEWDSMFSDPTRRVCLEDLHRLGDGYVARQCNQDVDVVRGSASAEDWDFVIASDAGEIFPQQTLELVGDQVATLFRAEDKMN